MNLHECELSFIVVQTDDYGEVIKIQQRLSCVKMKNLLKSNQQHHPTICKIQPSVTTCQ